MTIPIPPEIERQYNDEIIKANRNVTLTNQPGKTSPRWFASLRNLKNAFNIARIAGANTLPIQDKVSDAVEYLNRNCVR